MQSVSNQIQFMLPTHKKIACYRVLFCNFSSTSGNITHSTIWIRPELPSHQVSQNDTNVTFFQEHQHQNELETKRKYCGRVAEERMALARK